jgi:hypothetical protein
VVTITYLLLSLRLINIFFFIFHLLFQSTFSVVNITDTESSSSPLGISNAMLKRVLERFIMSFLERSKRECNFLADYYSLCVFIALRSANEQGNGLSPLETEVFLNGQFLLVHEYNSLIGKRQPALGVVEPPCILRLELMHLMLPLQTAAFQGAGLLPVNPCPNWLPTIMWKNIFVLSAICPAYRPFVLDLDPHLHGIYSVIDR